MSEQYPDSYEIEPFMPAISPGAPVPAPKYVPFDYGKMTPGNYYSHDLGFRNNPYTQQQLKSIQGKGLNVQIQGAQNKWFRPTAWNNSVSQSQLGSYGNNQKLMQRIGADSTAYEKAGRNARQAAHTKANVLADGSRVTSPNKSPVVILKGPKDLLHRPAGNPDFTPAKKPVTGGDMRDIKSYSNSKKNPNQSLSRGRPSAGNINPKRIIGHFPEGSNQMVKRPGNFTGRMPMIRGLGGGMLGMFHFPSLSRPSGIIETHDIFGRPIPEEMHHLPEMGQLSDKDIRYFLNARKNGT